MSHPILLLDEDDVYRIITNRLKRLFHIDLTTHIMKITRKHYFLGEGIDFKPNSIANLIAVLEKAGFHYDNPDNFCERLASLATKGKGYREINASPALHFQIHENGCNIHLDNYGFVSMASNGQKYYNPDLFKHIVDDLGWAIVQQKIAQIPSSTYTLRPITDRLHPVILPTSKTNYIPTIGGKFNIIQLENLQMSLDWNWKFKSTENTFPFLGLTTKNSRITSIYGKNNWTVSATMELGSSFSRPVAGVMINLNINN